MISVLIDTCQTTTPERLMEFLTDKWLLVIASMLMGAFHAVLFLQSAHDKITDWGGNLGWLTGHFEKSIFKNQVPMLLGVVTLFELITGLVALVSIYFSFTSTPEIAAAAAILSLITFVQLFTGQRIAKDYPGAGALVPYIVMSFLWLGIAYMLPN